MMIGSSHYRNPLVTAIEYASVRPLDGPTRGEDEIVDAVIDFYSDPVDDRIRGWADEWSPKVLGDPQPGTKPEIALHLSITTKNNLRVTWQPIMTQEQYNGAPSRFKAWLEDWRPGYPNHVPNELLFIRDIRASWSRAHRADENGDDARRHPSLLACKALRELFVDMPRLLGLFVSAHWQDVLGSDGQHPSLPRVRSIADTIRQASADNDDPRSSHDIQWSRCSYEEAENRIIRAVAAS